MKKIFALLAFIFPHGEAFPQPSDAVDVKHYRFKLELNDTTDIISGSADLTVISRKNIAEFELDLINKNDRGLGMVVTGVKMKGASLKFEHAGDRLRILLNTSLLAGNEFQVSIQYKGIPRDGLIISKNKFGDRTFFADNWPNRGRNWLPIVDHPADKAAVDFVVIAPLHYSVVANGVKIEETFLNSSQKLTQYKEPVPISTKVMVIGVGRFAVQQSGRVGHIPVESWVYAQNRSEGFLDYAIAVNILDFFNKRVGPYPYQKLANVQSKTTFGGLENASAIFYHENSVNGKGEQEHLVAHEVAHQWFGDSVTETDWSHLWLSEGFATYFALLYLEFTHGSERRKKEMREDRDKVIQYFRTDPQPVVSSTPTDPMKLLNANSYQKGSWVLHMLRHELGDTVFWKGIRGFYEKNRDGNASTRDFQAVMEQASGKNLTTFFDQWIYTGGHPILDVSWTFDAKNKILRLSIEQTQKSGTFKFPLDIAIGHPAGLPVVQTIQLDQKINKFEIPLGEKPFKIDIDPAVNLLFEANLRN